MVRVSPTIVRVRHPVVRVDKMAFPTVAVVDGAAETGQAAEAGAVVVAEVGAAQVANVENDILDGAVEQMGTDKAGLLPVLTRNLTRLLASVPAALNTLVTARPTPHDLRTSITGGGSAGRNRLIGPISSAAAGPAGPSSGGRRGRRAVPPTPCHRRLMRCAIHDDTLDRVWRHLGVSVLALSAGTGACSRWAALPRDASPRLEVDRATCPRRRTAPATHRPPLWLLGSGVTRCG